MVFVRDFVDKNIIKMVNFFLAGFLVKHVFGNEFDMGDSKSAICLLDIFQACSKELVSLTFFSLE